MNGHQFLVLLGLVATAAARAQINTRLGLLATNLGISPVGSNQQGQTASFTQGTSSTNSVASGRAPPVTSGEFGRQCCCVPQSASCRDQPPQGRDDDDLVGAGLIDPRTKGISTRIVNRPSPSVSAPIKSCPSNMRTCCYDNSNSNLDLSVFGRSCLTPDQANGIWQPACREIVTSRRGVKDCGTRQYLPLSTNQLTGSQTSPGEFPWTCLLLNQDNDFVGTCAIVPSSGNDNSRPILKVITAAHKLSKIGKKDLLKVRVGEYDASGFNKPETIEHEEYTVIRILKHPKFNSQRLDNNIALLTLDRPIDISQSTVNSACLPSCRDQFTRFQFTNGTGTRCWVAGWGKDGVTGQFQFIQRKVDLPLFEQTACEARLKSGLNQQRPGAGDRFRLSESEVCAGGELGKDACTGDGGSPLVCQSESGRWTVEGLVTWGIGCASSLPGVYAKVAHFTDWILSN